tara:strand:+ start:916 stop:1479 length:564 start_codon:yes stop_codon:yes gene_type:complete
MRIEIDGQEYDLVPDQDTKIDGGDLDTEFITLPSLLNRYGYLAAHARAEVDGLKYAMERLYAVVDAETRQEAERMNVRMTEKKIENTVITDHKYQKAKLAYIDARKKAGLLSAVLDALNAKKDCLISLGANQRATGGSGPRVLNPVDTPQFTQDTVGLQREKAKQVIAETRKKRTKRKPVRRSIKHG